MTTTYRTLISATELQSLPQALILDLSFDLAYGGTGNGPGAGEQAYLNGHIPGAHYLHLEKDLSGTKTGRNGRHPLPAREILAARLAGLGLQHGQQVVCYDGQGGMYAARAWWMLRWLGHDAVAVLDGGVQAWQAAGGALVQALPPAPQASTFQISDSLVGSVDAEQLLARLGTLRLIDARAEERFRGEVEPLDKQAGHIPGASNRLFKNNLAADGRFKSAAQLRAEFEPLLAPYGSAQVVHQCGSGVTACHNLLAMEHAGLGGSRLYPGSWSEWSADPRRPVARSVPCSESA